MKLRSRTDANQFTATLPIRTVSEANVREHWAIKAKRAKSQREFVWSRMFKRDLPKPPCVVTLTRIGVRLLDDDNLARSFKAIRDEVAKQLGVDDGDRQAVRWVYEQRKGKPKEYAVEIVVESVNDPLRAVGTVR